MKALLIAFVFLPGIAQAQQAAQSTVDPCVAAYQREIDAIRAAQTRADQTAINVALDDLVQINRNIACFSQFAAQRAVIKSIMRAFENSRTDKQEGAAAGGAGTSLVSRGVAPKVLSLAVENGALTQSVKSSVVTVKGNLAGVPSALVRRDVVPYCDPRFGGKGDSCISSDALRWLRRISFGVSFDTSRDAASITGTAAAGAGTGSGQQPSTPVVFTPAGKEVSQVTARYEIIDNRDVTSRAYQTEWRQKVKTRTDLKGAADALRQEIDQTIGELTEGMVYKAWFAEAEQTIRSAAMNGHDLAAVWVDRLSDLVVRLRASNQSFDEKLARLRAAFQTFDFVEDQFVDEISTKPVLTFEYVNNRPVAQAPVSVYRLIGDFGWSAANNITFNVAVGAYDEDQPDTNGQATGRLRDVEFGVQYERKLGKLELLGPAAVAIAAYFQDQRSPAILDVDPKQPIPGIAFVDLPAGSKKVFAEKGKIGVIQFRVVVGPEKSSARIPLSVSWSNRTELVDKPVWRAQVGLTYDFDALFAK